MRADRLLRLLMLLQRHRRVSAATLAQWLEVSERTVLRDMEALSAAGVPVYTERGRHGGCVLLDSFTTDASGLTNTEAQALFSWVSSDRAAELGLGKQLSSALAKVAASVPAQAVSEAEALGAVLLSDRRRWFTEVEAVPTLPQLRAAAVAGRRVRMTYSRPGKDSGERTVDPHGLVDNSGRWYLLATDRGQLKSFRVGRIVSVTVLDEPVQAVVDRPLGQLWAELRSAWEERRPYDPVEVEVRVAPAIAKSFLGIAGGQLQPGGAVVPVGRPDEHRWRLPIRARRSAFGLVLAWAPDVELLGPADLLADLTRHLGGLVELYPGGIERRT